MDLLVRASKMNNWVVEQVSAVEDWLRATHVPTFCISHVCVVHCRLIKYIGSETWIRTQMLSWQKPEHYFHTRCRNRSVLFSLQLCAYHCRHLLIVFGGVAGLEESKELDKTIKVFPFRLSILKCCDPDEIVSNQIAFSSFEQYEDQLLKKCLDCL
jgi:hypothetical protein